MYLDFYALAKAPFHIMPDPDFVYLSPSHQAALDAITYSVQTGQGGVAIFGEGGVGKTTLLRAYVARLKAQELTTMYVAQAPLTFQALLQCMFGELALEIPSGNQEEVLALLYQRLRAERRQGRQVVLILDEAQAIPLETLQQLCLFSPEDTTVEPLVQLVLVGQPELQQTLAAPSLRFLAQRLLMRTTIVPLTPSESYVYLQHRLAKVVQQDEPVFTLAALRQLVRHGQGLPRRLNVLATNALVAGFATQQRPITAAIVKRVVEAFGGKKKSARWHRLALPAAGLAVVAGLLWLGPWQTRSISLSLAPRQAQTPRLAPVAAEPGPRPATTSLAVAPVLPPQPAVAVVPQEETPPVPAVREHPPVTGESGVDREAQEPPHPATEPQPWFAPPEPKNNMAARAEHKPRPPLPRVAAVLPRKRSAAAARASQERLDSEAMTALLIKLDTQRRAAAQKTRGPRRVPPGSHWLSEGLRASSLGAGTTLQPAFASASHTGHDSIP